MKRKIINKCLIALQIAKSHTATDSIKKAASELTQPEIVRMEKAPAAVVDETQTLPDVKSIPIQSTFKRTHKKSVLHAIDNTSDESVLVERSPEMYKNVHDESQSCRRRSFDVVDRIGDKQGEVKDREHMTKVDATVSGSKRPATLDMNPTVSAEWNPEAQIRTSVKSSIEVTDSTPCTPPEPSNISETGSR
jgi:hypothetical protein